MSARSLIASRKRRTFVAVIVLALLLAVGAFAYFTSTGQGSGVVTAGVAQDVTITAGTPSSELFPGGSADVAATIHNPNDIEVTVPSLVLDTSHGDNGFAVDAGHSTCDMSSLSFTGQDNSGAGWAVPPKVGTTDGELPLDLTNAISMSNAAANDCQGATFTVYLQVGS
jgi:predicted ribosomally synthesized peptide with SipW-like signal peptide